MAPPAPPASALTFDHLLEGTKRYDAVIKIEVFTDAFKYDTGWPVAVSQSAEHEREACTAIRVALAGNVGVGKTWLIQQLCGVGWQVPSISHSAGPSPVGPWSASHPTVDAARRRVILMTAKATARHSTNCIAQVPDPDRPGEFHNLEPLWTCESRWRVAWYRTQGLEAGAVAMYSLMPSVTERQASWQQLLGDVAPFPVALQQ
jgi:hypothetical protein